MFRLLCRSLPVHIRRLSKEELRLFFLFTDATIAPSYAQITPEYRPAELHDVYKTIEYNLSATQAAAGGHATPQVAPDYAPIFAIVVDTCCEDAEQFAKMKESLQWIVDVLPSNSKICLVSFGSVVTVHELVFDFCPRKVVLRGLVDIPPRS